MTDLSEKVRPKLNCYNSYHDLELIGKDETHNFYKCKKCGKEIRDRKEMLVKKGIIYTVGEFTCPQCKKHCVIKCNPKGKTKKHWIE